MAGEPILGIPRDVFIVICIFHGITVVMFFLFAIGLVDMVTDSERKEGRDPGIVLLYVLVALIVSTVWPLVLALMVLGWALWTTCVRGITLLGAVLSTV